MRSFVALLALSLSGCAALGQASLIIEIGKPEQTVTGLPFSADQSVRLVQQLGNGITVTHEMKGHVYRSTSGLQRFDGTLVATDPAAPKPVTIVWVLDPLQHTALSWNTGSKTARLTRLPENGRVIIRFLPEPRLPADEGRIQPQDLTTSDLGRQTRDKLLLVGKRVTGTIPAGKIGNEQPIVVTADAWVSPELKLAVSETEEDPRAGNRMFELTNIQRGEPDAALFKLPDGYTVTIQPNLMPAARTGPPVSSAQVQQIANARTAADPTVKDDVAYTLAMGRNDIPDAHLLAGQAVQIEEQRTAGLKLKDANAENFSQMVALSCYWNTLGVVYFREGNLAKAEAYVRAAWELDPRGYFGAHLGRIYERQHRTQDAISIYRSALSASGSAGEKEGLRVRLTDLGIADAEPLPISMPTPLLLLGAHETKADALFDILLTNGTPPAVLFLQGSKALKTHAAATAIQAALQTSLPDDGPEKILRRARVTCARNGTPRCTLHFFPSREAEGQEVSLSG